MTGPERASGEARERIRSQLEHGAPWDACDTFRDARAAHPDDAGLLYWGALAHARAGATHEAHALLDRAQAAAAGEPDLLPDILSLRGRLWKDAFHRAPVGSGAAAAAESARREYLAAYALHGDPYPGVNAASLSLLLGDRRDAQRIAREVAAALAARTTPLSHWDHATAGEAHLLLGDVDAARDAYRVACANASGDAGSVATMRRQVRLIARAMPEAIAVLEVLPAADVVAFAGHMIDTPDRPVPRFPPALEPAVDAAIRAALARLHEPVIYTSAACGADLLLIEAAHAIGAEVNVVLPFDREDFVATSVAIGGADWIGRFNTALAKATRVILATEEGYLDDDVLFDYAALLLEGLAVLRATQLETSPSLLCVQDAGTAGGLGGTHASVERWSRHFGPPQAIDLRELRERAPRVPIATTTATTGTPARASPEDRLQRTLKTLLFADFAGFSRLHDAYAPLFQSRFLEIVAAEIEAAPVKPLDSKTWGDGLYVVFESPRDGAEFALRLQASMLAVDWKAAGLSESSRIRIALHAGPVFSGHDPIMGRVSYFGSNVTRAARIEPVTPPGSVYASEAFAATLAASGAHDCALEYVGRLALAKSYGESRIYRLARR